MSADVQDTSSYEQLPDGQTQPVPRRFWHLSLDEYQARAMSTATEVIFGDRGIEYLSLKLNGEAGEIAEKVGKALRGDAPLNNEDLAKEIGDVLWYLAVLAWKTGYTLGEIAQMNVDKLASRKERGVLKGSGDDR